MRKGSLVPACAQRFHRWFPPTFCHDLHPPAPEAPSLPQFTAYLPGRCSDDGGGVLAWQALAAPRNPTPFLLHTFAQLLLPTCISPPNPAFSSCPEPSSTKEPSGTLSPDPASRFGTDTCSSPLLGKHLLYPQMSHHTQPPTPLSNHQCLPRIDLCQARGRGARSVRYIPALAELTS